MDGRRSFFKKAALALGAFAAGKVKVEAAKPEDIRVVTKVVVATPEDDLPDGYYCSIRRATLHLRNSDTGKKGDSIVREWVGDDGWTKSITYDLSKVVKTGGYNS